MIRSLIDLIASLLPLAVVIGLLGLPVLAFFARFGDGPMGPLSGGPMRGDIREVPDLGWGFASGLETVELQIASAPPRSVRVGLIVHEGALYVPAALTPVNRWRDSLLDDPRVLVRVGTHLYDGYAAPVRDPEWEEALFDRVHHKYGEPLFGDWARDKTSFFRIDPPRTL